MKIDVRSPLTWAPVVTWLAALLSGVFRADLAPYVPAVTIGAATVTSGAIALAHVHLVRPTSLSAAVADAKAVETALRAAIVEARQAFGGLPQTSGQTATVTVTKEPPTTSG